MGVLEAVERDVARIAERDPHLAESGMAASALLLAEQLDGCRDLRSAASVAAAGAAAKVLLETLNRLRDLSPPAEEDDEIDHLGVRAALKLVG